LIPGSDVGTLPCVDPRSIVPAGQCDGQRGDDANADDIMTWDPGIADGGSPCVQPVGTSGMAAPQRGSDEAAGGAASAIGLGVIPLGASGDCERGRAVGGDSCRDIGAAEDRDAPVGTSDSNCEGRAGPAACAARHVATRLAAWEDNGDLHSGRRVRRRLRGKTAVDRGSPPRSSSPSGSAPLAALRAWPRSGSRDASARVGAVVGANRPSAGRCAGAAPHSAAAPRAAAPAPWRPAREFDWPRGPQLRGDAVDPTVSEPAQ
jgi:hypothetical protein